MNLCNLFKIFSTSTVAHALIFPQAPSNEAAKWGTKTKYPLINKWREFSIRWNKKLLLAQNPDYWLRDNNNRIVLLHGDKRFPQPDQGMLVPDYRIPEVQQLWASECINITRDNYGIVDGCFIDKPQFNSFGVITLQNKN